MLDRRQHRDALHSFIADRRPDLAVSFNLKHALNFDTLQSTIHLFMNKLQRVVDGRNWNRVPPADRPAAIGMLENPDTNPHVHASLYAPARYVEFLLSDAAQPLWSSCHRNCGQLDVAPPRDVRRWASYQIKFVRGGEALDCMVLYVPQARVANSSLQPARQLAEP
ncbi:hypothetical protein [Falsiroseomonas sp. CW058]|uniref:hypothetical protein n=1 Tax=Falsiroseomonas sp. CW058 TaxID=3388664 RepID=UPI003D31DFDE